MSAASLSNNAINAYKNQQNQLVDKSQVVTAIQKASVSTGVDFAYLMHKADQESGFKPDAKAATSSATGLFQFIKSTWLQMVKEHGAKYGLGEEAKAIEISQGGQASVKDKEMLEKIYNLRNDPVLSSSMAAEFTRDNKDYLDAKVGGRIGSTELYMAHFLGAGGAEKFLNVMRADPLTKAAEILPDAADANRSVFYGKNGAALSVSEIYNHFAAKFKDQNGSSMEALVMGRANHSSSLASLNNISSLPNKPRDLAELSADFYVAPSPELSNCQANSTTADTLFNVMVLTQMKMKDALSSYSGAVTDADNKNKADKKFYN